MVCILARFVAVQLLSLGAFAQHDRSVTGSWENSDRPFDLASALRAVRTDASDEPNDALASDDEDEDTQSVLMRLLSASTGPSSNSTSNSTNSTSTSNSTSATSSSTHKVTVSLTMSVTDPDAFVANTANKGIVEQTFATNFNVPLADVTVVLSVGTSRRLKGGRRLTTKHVKVDADLAVADAAAATTLKATVDGTTAAQFTTALTTAFTNAGQTNLGISVTAVTTAVVDTSTATRTASHAKLSSSIGSVTAAVCTFAALVLTA